MSFFKPPSAPDPTATSNAQAGFNQQAATAQQQTNMINQQTPYGSLNYAADPNAPGGYSANVTLSPAQQQLLNTQQGTQQNIGNAASSLSGSLQGLYGAPPNLDASTGATAQKLNQWQQQYLQPIFNQQQSNLDASLQNQGITQGSEAWNNAQNLQARNTGDVTNQYLTQNEGQAYSQALQDYQLPGATLQALMGGATPQGPSFQQTPQATIQPPNYAGQVQQNYQNQTQQYGNLMQGLFSIPSALAGGWARGGFSMPGSGSA